MIEPVGTNEIPVRQQHRDPLPIALFKLRVTGDIDDSDPSRLIPKQLCQLTQHGLAQAAFAADIDGPLNGATHWG